MHCAGVARAMRPDTLRRRLLRRIPVLSRAARSLDRLELERAQLLVRLGQLDELHMRRTASLSSDPIGPDGLPLPPPALRQWVTGTDGPQWFAESGRRGARALADLLERRRIALGELDSVLDFGCGCGRVLRHLRTYEAVRLHGSDCNRAAIAWCDEALPFAEFGTNRLEPPTRYRAGSFDLVYALSVFTHLSEPLQAPWMAELHRILRPGTYLVITTHGASYGGDLAPAERVRFERGELVVVAAEQAGRNDCGAYHPEPYVRGVLAKGFDVLEFVPEGALGNPHQDLYLLQRRD